MKWKKTQPQIRLSTGILRPPLPAVSAGAAGACTLHCCAAGSFLLGRRAARTLWGLHAAALCSSPEQADGCTSPAALMQTRLVLLEPGAGCCLWPLVLQSLGSAHADANQGLRSTQLSAFDAGAWLAEPLSAQGDCSGQTCLFFAQRPVEHVFKGGDPCMHLTAMGAGLLFQGEGGLRKARVRPCLGAPKELHSARTPWQPAEEAGAVVLLLNDFRI